jgi:hypothetical protein
MGDKLFYLKFSIANRLRDFLKIAMCRPADEPDWIILPALLLLLIVA